MSKYNNRSRISISIKNNFSFENINSLFSKIPSVLGDVEYIEFSPENTKSLSPEKFISETLPGEIRSLYLLWNETGCRFSFYNDSQKGFTLFVRRFGNYLEIDNGCKDSWGAGFDKRASEKVFDTRRYLTLLLDLCQDLTIENIEVDEEYLLDSVLLPFPTANSLAVALGCPPGLDDRRACGDYLTILLKNMNKAGGIECTYTQGASPRDAVTLLCSWNNYDVKVHLTPKNHIIMFPINEIKYTIINDLKVVDAAFYTELLLIMCEGIGIREFETYFNREGEIYYPELYQPV